MRQEKLFEILSVCIYMVTVTYVMIYSVAIYTAIANYRKCNTHALTEEATES